MRPLSAGILAVLLFLAACHSQTASTPFAAPPGAREGRPVREALGALPEAREQAPLSEVGKAAPTPIPMVLNPAARMVIQNAEMRLEVAQVDEALTRIEALAVDAGGYILSARTWFEGGEKTASLTFAVPAERFAETLGRLRRIGLRVLEETTAGQDVSQEYVDLEARLANLEAAAARLREFLRAAGSVEEALQVEARLRELEGEIAQVKGRMNYLRGRSAYSLITVFLQPLRPTPTPTPTPTPWSPGATFRDATRVLAVLLRGLVDLGIWAAVLGGPFAVPAGLVAFAVYRRRRRSAGRAAGG